MDKHGIDLAHHEIFRAKVGNGGINSHSLNSHADVYSLARGLKFGLSVHLHHYFVYASCEGSGQSVHLYRLTEPLVLDIAKSTKISCADL